MMKKIFIILILAVFVSGILGTQSVKAQGVGIFGGFILNSFFCPCSGNFLLTISPPVGGQFLYQIGSPQYPNFSLPRPGVWTLGLYNPGGACMIPVPLGCAPVGFPLGTITPTVGTSL